MTPKDMLEEVRAIAERAGAAIMEIYGAGFEVRRKDDASPVTEADEAAEAIILPALKVLAPDIPAVAEEEVSQGRIPEIGADLFWLIDPLDGTKEFIARNGEFTVNIALIEGGVPVLGVVVAPALGQVYAGAGPGTATFREGDVPPVAVSARRPHADGVVVASSRSHANPEALARFLGDKKVVAHKSIGSSLKFCLVARGEADIYPRFGPTMEWDTAAGHAVLLAAGGSVETLDGAPLTYRKPGFRNPEFIARGLPG